MARVSGSTAPRAEPRRGPLILLETGNLISGIGNGVALVVLPWLVLDRTGSATAAGAVAAATLLPLLVSSLFSGTVVDVVGRRRTALVSDLLSGISVAAIPLLDLAGGLTTGWLVALAMVGAALDPAGFTAREAMLPGAATAAHWPWDRANGVHEAVYGVAFLLGPGLGGLLIGWVGALSALWATAAGFAIAVVLTGFLRVAGAGRPAAHERPGSIWHGTVEGLAFVWRQQLLRWLALLSCLLVAAYLPFESVLLPVYFTQIGSPEQLGLVVTAMSGGGIVGALAYPALVRAVRRQRLFVWCVLGTSLALVGLAAFPSVWLMLVLGALAGACWGPVNPILNLAMQVLTPERLRGRVIGVLTSTAFAAGPLGLLAAGPMVDGTGVRTAALVFAGLVLVVAVTGFVVPALHGLDDLREPTHAVPVTGTPGDAGTTRPDAAPGRLGSPNPSRRTPMHGQVEHVEPLTPHLVRVVLGGAGLDRFGTDGWTDTYVNLLFLPPDAPYTVPFDVKWARTLPREQWPAPRRYTVRHWDPERRRLTLDFVVHGDEGVAGPWARDAQPGDLMQLQGPGGGYAPDPDADWHLLVGDESALPAIAAALEQLAPTAHAVAVLLVDGPDDELALTCPGRSDVTWLHRDSAAGDQQLADAVRALDFPPGRVHAFVHGEAGETRAVRRHLLGDRGVAREALSVSPYWRRTFTDERWREVKQEWLAEVEQDV